MTGRTKSDAVLENAVRELASTPRLLVALDFDGTISPFVDNPYEARVIQDAAAPIARLEAFPDTWVAYVSGRPLDSLARVTESDERALLIGSHGAEERLDGGKVALQLDDHELRRIDLLGAALAELIERTPGAVLEKKPVGYGVHTRRADPSQVPAIHAEARDAAERIGGFLNRDGKDILEFAARDATKGDGIERLRQRLSASAVFYAGDDVTDEDGFAVMRTADLGLKVGEGTTMAAHRVGDIQAVAGVLNLLAEARSERHRT